MLDRDIVRRLNSRSRLRQVPTLAEVLGVQNERWYAQ